MKYVFFTNSMGGYSGGPTYVRNKLLYLKEHGWDVIVFDSTGYYNSEILLQDLRCFGNNRYQELFFNPFWLRKSRRERIMSEIISKIGNDERTVIESNTVAMSLWGELIASRIDAKHIIYLLSERLTVSDKSLYKFFKFKAERKELFSINEKAYNILLSKFEKVSDADQYYWSAKNFVPIEDIECTELEHVKKADYNIGHFGRRKGYFDEMFKGVADFANKNKDKSVNFILLGDAKITAEQKNTLSSNIFMYQLKARQPLPKMFFDKTDVIIAVAGCASIALVNGAKVISMDVYNNVPLGVMGYNTKDSNIRSKDNKYSKSLSETLDDVLVNRLYDTAPQMEIKPSNKGYDYQVEFATFPDKRYYDEKKYVLTKCPLSKYWERILLYLDMVSICSLIRYKNRRKNH